MDSPRNQKLYLDSLEEVDTEIASISTIAYVNLRNLIISGKLRPGQRIHPQEIAERMNISPMPVREAIQRLQNEGFATVSPRKGTFISEISVEDFNEIYDMRIALEVMAVELACDRIRAETLDELDRLTEQKRRVFQEGIDISRWMELNGKWHLTLFKAAGNKRLYNTLSELWYLSARVFGVVKQFPGFGSNRIDEHQAIVEKIRKKDVEGARKTAEKHIRKARKVILEHIRLLNPEPPASA